MVVDYVRYYARVEGGPSEPVASEGYTYHTNAAGRAIVTGFSPDYVGALSIPDVLGGCPVAGIGMSAFENCVGVTAVTLPAGVTSVGKNAFAGCKGLTSVKIPVGVTDLKDGVQFAGCTGLEAIDVAPGNKVLASVDGVVFDKGLTKLIVLPDDPEATRSRPASRQLRIGRCSGRWIPETSPI